MANRQITLKGLIMGTKHTNKLKVLLWVFIVYILSSLCYVPVLFEQYGIAIPNGLLLLKYLFVCIPAMAAILLSVCEHTFKTYLSQMFSGKIAIKHIMTWVVFTIAGILTSLCYSFLVSVDVLQNTYLSITALLTACIYLFLTAFVEEVAWRGFLLERVSLKEKSSRSILLTGIIWTVWHMPMWIIRNSMGIEQILYFCIWTFLVSVVLGVTYYQCKNVVLVAILHTTFNICYLAPVKYNIVVLAILIAMGTLFTNKYKEIGE